jgi:DNA repair exonuclease SbcCD ATPase subunit
LEIKLNSLEINLIGAIGENQQVIIPQNQLTAIIGENEDDGGSNGSSKSTLVQVIPILFFGPSFSGKTAKELKNDKIKGTPKVKGSISIDRKVLIIDRTIGGELKVNFDGNDIIGSTADVQAKINGIIGMTPEQFMQFAYKGQKDSEHFLTMKDSEKKEFLSSFFDTSKLEKLKELADKDLSETKKELIKVNGKREQISSDLFNVKKELEMSNVSYAIELEHRKENLQTFNLLIKSNSEQLETLLAIKQDDLLKNDQDWVTKSQTVVTLTEVNGLKIRDLSTEINNLSLVLQGHKSKLALNTPPDSLKEDLAVCDTLIKEQRQGLSAISTLKSNIVSISQNIANAQNSITEIINKACPTCKQDLQDDHKEKLKVPIALKVTVLQNELELSKEMLQSQQLLANEEDLQALMTRKAEISSEIANFSANIAKEVESSSSIINLQIKNKESEQKALMQEATAATLALNNAESLVLGAYQKSLSECKAQGSHLKSKKDQVELQIKNINDKLASLQKQYDTCLEKLEQSVKESKTLETKVETLEHTSFVLSKNGFVGHLFDSILDELNSEINNNLKLVPVTRKFTLQFSPDKTTKTTGETSKAIDYELYSDGQQVTLNRCSGAEELVILIAVDEACESVLSRRLGINIGFKILDEQLYWVDGNSKEFVFEFYRQKAESKAYLIIDHSSEFNAAFDSRIKVIKKNGVSTIHAE